MTRRENKEGQLRQNSGTTGQRDEVLVKVICEHSFGPSCLSSWRPGEDISHDTIRQNLIGGTILKTENDRIWMLHNKHVYHSIKEQNSNGRQHSAFKTHFGLRRTGESPLNPHVLAQYSTTLESARHSHSRNRRVDRTSLNSSGNWIPMQQQQRKELVPIHDTGPELRTSQYWSANINSPIKRPRRHHRKKKNSPKHITSQNLNLGLSVSVCIQLCQVLP